MKKLMFALIAVSFMACNDAKKEDVNEVTPTPQGIEGLSNAAPAQNESGQTLNPAHGMPGHDCAVEVGAPLPSKASTVVADAPVQTETTAPATSTNVRTNPAHGMPGHDCSIAVGAPLQG